MSGHHAGRLRRARPGWLPGLGRVAWESAPAVGAASVAMATAFEGSLRVYSAVVAAWAAYATVQRAIFGRRANLQRKAVDGAREERRNVANNEMFRDAASIATVLAVIGSAGHESDLRQTGKRLIATVLASAARCCGLAADPRPRTEASYYALDDPRDQLVRNQVTSGYRVDELPGKWIDAKRQTGAKCMVGHARTGSGVLVEGVSGSAAGMVVRVGVPVRSRGVSRGILFVESSESGAILRLDEGFLSFLAGALAAGLTLLGDEINGSTNYAETTDSTAGSHRGETPGGAAADVKEADDD